MRGHVERGRGQAGAAAGQGEDRGRGKAGFYLSGKEDVKCMHYIRTYISAYKISVKLIQYV